MLFVAWYVLFVVACCLVLFVVFVFSLMVVARRSLFVGLFFFVDGRCPLLVARLVLLFVVCCLLLVMSCLLMVVACCLVIARCWSCVCLLVVHLCMLFVVRCLVFGVWCWLSLLVSCFAFIIS